MEAGGARVARPDTGEVVVALIHLAVRREPEVARLQDGLREGDIGSDAGYRAERLVLLCQSRQTHRQVGNMARSAKPTETAMRNSASCPRTLDVDELDHVAGGIIIIGGVPQLVRQFVPLIDKVTLNPQPLPPRILSLAFGE